MPQASTDPAAPATELRRADTSLLAIGVPFAAVGTISFVVGAWFFDAQYQFRRDAVHAEGKVVRVLRASGTRSPTYYPVVRFKPEIGPEVEVSTDVGVSRGEYHTGDLVPVVYPRGRANDAQVDSAVERWFGAAFGGGFAACFGIPGWIMLALGLRGWRDARWARRHGQSVQTTFVAVERNTRIRINGRNPRFVVSEWRNPRDGRRYRFKSGNLSRDASEDLVPGHTISVLIDPENPSRYWVDLSAS